MKKLNKKSLCPSSFLHFYASAYCQFPYFLKKKTEHEVKKFMPCLLVSTSRRNNDFAKSVERERERERERAIVSVEQISNNLGALRQNMI